MQLSQIIGQSAAKHHVLDAMHKGKLPHALLLCGNEGVGELALATAIAQLVNCLNPSETDSCGVCDNCKRIAEGLHPDVHYIFPIAGSENNKKLLSTDFHDEFRAEFFKDKYLSFEQWQEKIEKAEMLLIGVEEIREAKRILLLKSFQAPFKILIVWNIEKINVSAANAFLKILEEPPVGTMILMTCNDTGRLLTTINSRCQRLFLQRLSPDDIAQYLMEQKQLPEKQAYAIARISDGSILNAKTYTNEAGQKFHEIYIAWLRAIYGGDYVKIHTQIEGIAKSSREYKKAFLQYAIRKIRDSFLYHLQLSEIALVTEEDAEFHQRFGKLLTPPKTEAILFQLEESIRYISGNANPQIVFMALSLKMYSILKMP